MIGICDVYDITCLTAREAARTFAFSPSAEPACRRFSVRASSVCVFFLLQRCGDSSRHDSSLKLSLSSKENGNMCAQRHFRVSETCAQHWRRRKTALGACNSKKKAFHDCGPLHPQLEQDLADFMHGVRQRLLPVTCKVIRTKTVEFARAARLDRFQFKGSASWVRQFMKRKRFSL